MLKKVAFPSLATALANSVFPVPGGPKSKTPFQGFNKPFSYHLSLYRNMEFLFIEEIRGLPILKALGNSSGNKFIS